MADSTDAIDATPYFTGLVEGGRFRRTYISRWEYDAGRYCPRHYELTPRRFMFPRLSMNTRLLLLAKRLINSNQSPHREQQRFLICSGPDILRALHYICIIRFYRSPGH